MRGKHPIDDPVRNVPMSLRQEHVDLIDRIRKRLVLRSRSEVVRVALKRLAAQEKID